MAKKNKRRADGRIPTTVHWTSNGESHQKTLYARSHEELVIKETELRRKLGLKIDVSAENDTFGQWCDLWLKLKKHETSFTWYNTLKSYTKRFETLRTNKICSIKSIDLQSLIYQLSNGGDSQKALAQKTLNTIKSMMLKVFQLAIDNRILEYNPAHIYKNT